MASAALPGAAGPAGGASTWRRCCWPRPLALDAPRHDRIPPRRQRRGRPGRRRRPTGRGGRSSRRRRKESNATFAPSIIGFAAPLANLSALADGNGPPAALLALVALYLAVWSLPDRRHPRSAGALQAGHRGRVLLRLRRPFLPLLPPCRRRRPRPTGRCSACCTAGCSTDLYGAATRDASPSNAPLS